MTEQISGDTLLIFVITCYHHITNCTFAHNITQLLLVNTIMQLHTTHVSNVHNSITHGHLSYCLVYKLNVDVHSLTLHHFRKNIYIYITMVGIFHISNYRRCVFCKKKKLWRIANNNHKRHYRSPCDKILVKEAVEIKTPEVI